MSNFYLLTTDALTFYYDRIPYSVTSDHPNWADIVQHVTQDNLGRAVSLISAQPDTHALLKKANLQNTKFKISGDTVYYDGVAQPEHASKYIIDILVNGWPMAPVVNFFARLAANPSRRSREMALESVVVNKFPIAPDGRFMAYKRVRDDFFDCHSGTMDNSPGRVVTMPRHEVDDDPNRTCSSGLHACARSYLRSFYGQKLIAVAIDPANVVCVPTDYNNTKMRVCEYEVMYELPLAIVTSDREAWESPVVADDYLASPAKVGVSDKKYVYVLVAECDVDCVTNAFCGEKADLQFATRYETQAEAIYEQTSERAEIGARYNVLLCRVTPKGRLKPITVVA